MPSKLDEISVKIGELGAGVRYQAAELENLRRDMDANRGVQSRRHEENQKALADLSGKVERQIATVSLMQPTVAALELSRSKLARWASIGIATVALLGWMFEATIKWVVTWFLTKLGS